MLFRHRGTPSLLQSLRSRRPRSLPHASLPLLNLLSALHFSSATTSLPGPSSQPLILTLALSGPPTSGKSTISYLLHHLLSRSTPSPPFQPMLPVPPLHLLADDFMLDDAHLPLSPSGRFPDAETPRSIHRDGLINSLRYVQDRSEKGGRGEMMPDGHLSWQGLNYTETRRHSQELVGGESAVIHLMKILEKEIGLSALSVLRSGKVRLVILDGFLLFHDEEVRRLCDLRILLRLSKGEAKRRRGQKPGFWGNRSATDKDGMGKLVGLGDDFGKVDYWRTEEYFEECVWKSWESTMGWLFQDGDVEARPRDDLETEGITIGPLDWGPRVQAEWVVEVVGEWLRNVLEGAGGASGKLKDSEYRT